VQCQERIRVLRAGFGIFVQKSLFRAKPLRGGSGRCLRLGVMPDDIHPNGVDAADKRRSGSPQRAAGWGGEQSFAEAGVSGEVTPIPDLPALILNGEVRPT
jgi:hypothetical protein